MVSTKIDDEVEIIRHVKPNRKRRVFKEERQKPTHIKQSRAMSPEKVTTGPAMVSDAKVDEKQIPTAPIVSSTPPTPPTAPPIDINAAVATILPAFIQHLQQNPQLLQQLAAPTVPQVVAPAEEVITQNNDEEAPQQQQDSVSEVPIREPVKKMAQDGKRRNEPNPCISHRKFKLLCKEMLAAECARSGLGDMEIRGAAVEAIQMVAEGMLINLFRKSLLVARKAGRDTVKVKDMRVALGVRNEPGQDDNNEAS